MTGLSTYLGRGLLMLALASSAFACGDDDGGDGTQIDGGGGTGGGGGGTGGTDGGAGTGGGGSCVADATAATMGATSMACLTCACGADEAAVTECNGTCWALIDCFGDPAKCGTVDRMDMGAAVTCITSMCPDVDIAMAAAAAPAATALGMVLSGECASDCAPAAPGDAGTDSGGPDVDGGDTDGGS